MGKKPELIEVRITNWERYQKDKVGKRNNTKEYFRIYKKMVLDWKIQSLNHVEFRLFITLMCHEVDGKIQILGSYLRNICKIHHESLTRCLAKLLELELIEPLYNTREYNKIEYNTDENKIAPKIPKKRQPKKEAESEFSPDLERLYEKYPRKMGKSKGLEKLRKIIKTENDLADFEKALDRFIALTAKAKTEPQFIPHFSTFVNSHWQDYLDENVGEHVVTEQDEIERQRHLDAWGFE